MDKCPTCNQEVIQATSLAIHGMYDCHAFHRYTGRTVDELIKNWKKHNKKKHPARFSDGTTCDDLGPTMLCPVIVLDQNDKEMRRVGKMVQEVNSKEAIEAYRQALIADPDIPRLLSQATGAKP